LREREKVAAKTGLGGKGICLTALDCRVFDRHPGKKRGEGKVKTGIGTLGD